ncbi:MAG TPA: hypothetical protein VFJ82_20835 [Longimicrobium sp.]|nr:hypothetical protein [Longimicrobium sp.]
MVVACGKNLTFTAPDDPLVPLFEVETQSTAFFPYWAGFYVDGEGHVYRWNRTDASDPAFHSDVLTPEQLAAKYLPGKTLVGTVASSEVLQRYGLVGPAASDGLASRKHSCADAGIQTFSAWVLQGDGNYHRILLHQRGDEATARRNAAARTLWTWLAEVTGENEPTEFCDPYYKD